MRVRWVEARESGGRSAASTRSGQSVGRASRSIDDRPDLMVVPSVGVVIHDYHRRAVPSGQLFQKVDRIYQESVLVQRVGVSGVAVLIAGCLQETHCRQIASGRRAEETISVVLVGGLTGVSRY